MADTEVKTNGLVDGDRIPWDPDDPEVQKQMRRPADIDQDMKEMDRRKRVEMILNSNIFREELERVIEAQLKEGYNPASLIALQQISELIVPHSHFSGASLGIGSAIPINDIRGVESLGYAKGERILRCKLASLYRLVDLLGYSQGIFNHITVRLSQDQEHFLINPFGLMYHEITAASLVKVDLQGNVIDPGVTNLGINPAGYTIHSAIHAARPDIRCVIHVHVPDVVAVASYKHGLLPLSQEALLCGEISYHEYFGLAVDEEERQILARDLGPQNKILMLHNHGVVVCGETVEEAFSRLYHLVLACHNQVKIMPYGYENMRLIPDSVVKRFNEQVSKFERRRDDDGKQKGHSRKAISAVDLLFEGYMRMLDNAGYRTGYIYRAAISRSEAPRQRNDVEIPPASTAYTHIFDEDDLVKYSPLKKLLDSRRVQDKTRWLNSPNVYQKVEFLETGSTDPKKVTKWVAEGSPTHGATSIKIENTHQFSGPTKVDPAEFKRKQKELKENRMQSKITAGPQSHILEGTTWEEAKKLQDATTSGTGDQVVVVGAASKGIIQREFQHNAMVYKAPYAKNPFDSVTDEDLEEYKRTIEKKQKGDVDEVEVVQSVETHQTEEIVRDTETPVAELSSLPQSPTSPMSEDEAIRKSSKLPPPSPKIVISHVHINHETRDVSPPVAIRNSRKHKKGTELNQHHHKHHHHSQSSPTHTNTSTDRSSNELGENAMNGDDVDAKEGIRSAESGDNVSGASRSSKEGSPTKEAPGLSPKKEKKKKKGLRTPSFLKKKKEKK